MHIVLNDRSGMVSFEIDHLREERLTLFMSAGTIGFILCVLVPTSGFVLYQTGQLLMIGIILCMFGLFAFMGYYLYGRYHGKSYPNFNFARYNWILARKYTALSIYDDERAHGYTLLIGPIKSWLSENINQNDWFVMPNRIGAVVILFRYEKDAMLFKLSF